MKGAALGWGVILVLLILTSFAIIHIVGTGNVSRTVVVRTGSMISLVNEAEMTTKLFDSSLNAIAQRAAYDFGNENNEWTRNSPNLAGFKADLLARIKRNTPNDDISGPKNYSWGKEQIGIQECVPLENSACFTLSGRKEFVVSEERFDTILIINHSINTEISSSIFRIFNIGREILEESQYSSLLSNPQDLDTKLEQDFPGFEFDVTGSNGFTNVIIEDRSCNLITDFGCIAPLKSSESKVNINGDPIPYDYLKLKFKVSA